MKINTAIFSHKLLRVQSYGLLTGSLMRKYGSAYSLVLLAGILLLLEQIADFSKKLFLFARFCWSFRNCWFILFLKSVDGLDKYENTESHNQKVNNILDKHTILDFCILKFKCQT